mmetsp:Transcript_38964/g.94205  ORF Transcript_38964/g.94205 Transcript_38964/m.94205 type:complete len:457 (-) Transcript_38964:460-1830(-)
MDTYETTKSKSAIRLWFLVPLTFTIVLHPESDGLIKNRISTTTHKNSSVFHNHSFAAPSIGSIFESSKSSINVSTRRVVDVTEFSDAELEMEDILGVIDYSTTVGPIMQSSSLPPNDDDDTSTHQQSKTRPIDETELSAAELELEDMLGVSDYSNDGNTHHHHHQHEVFSYARLDRSGAAIHDMLMCHALAFSRGWKYLGACPKNSKKFKKEAYDLGQRKELLRMLGVDFHVYSKCPKGTKMVKSFEYYGRPDLFTAGYFDHLRSTSKPLVGDLVGPHPKPRPPTITVHIRRGDVTPCRKENGHYSRYLPNQHYLKLIDRYKEQLSQRIMKKTSGVNYTSDKIEVLVFSESESLFESFEAFENLGHRVVLDGDLQRAWKFIIFSSDVVILSRSSFSMVPAIFSQALSPNPTTVVYTPFWHDPLEQFDNVGDLYPELVEATAAELRRMNSTCTKATA